jgi:hypothetical protein
MIKEVLGEYAKQLNKDYAGDRTSTVGASEIGLCERRVFLTKLALRRYEERKSQVSKPEAIEETGSWGAHVRGSLMEEHFWVPALKLRYGNRLSWIGRDQKQFKKDYLSATPDGVLTGVKNELREFGIKTVKSGCVLVECKTIDPRVNLREAKAENRYQVQAQMGLVRDCTKHKPEHAIISYTNASFWDEVTEYVEIFNPKIYANAHARAKRIMTAKSIAEMKPEGYIAGQKECEYCPFVAQCYKDIKDVPKYETRPEDVDPQGLEYIKQKCDEYVELQQAEEELRSEKEGVKIEIKDELKKRNIRKIKGVVSWSPVKGAARVDNEALHAECERRGIDVDSFRVTGNPTDRFEVL